MSLKKRRSRKSQEPPGSRQKVPQTCLSRGPPHRNPGPELVRGKTPVVAPLRPLRLLPLEMRRRHRRVRTISGSCSGNVFGAYFEMPRDHAGGVVKHFLKRSSCVPILMSHVLTGRHPRRNPSSSLTAVKMEDVQEFQESTTIKFEWTLRGLKQLFESRYGHFPSFDPRTALLVAYSSHLITAAEGKQSPRSQKA